MPAIIVRQNEGLDGALTWIGPGCEREGMIQDTQGLARLERPSQTRRKRALKAEKRTRVDKWKYRGFASPFDSTGRSLERNDRVLLVETGRG